MPLSFEQAAAEVLNEQMNGDAGVATSPLAGETQTSAPLADPFEAAAKQVRDDQVREDRIQAQLLNWRAANDKADAGVRADVLRYSAASGLSPSYVEQNLENVRKKVDADATDWNLVAHRQPALVQFMLEQPEMLPLVKDDAANLSGIEWAITAPFHAFLDALNEQRTVALQFKEAAGMEGAGAGNQERIRALEREYSNKDYGAEGFFQQGLVGTARMLPFLVGDIGARAIGGGLGGWAFGASGAAAGGAAGAPVAGVGAVPGAAGGGFLGGLTGAGVGSFVASGLFNYYESVGPLYWRLSNLKDANGQMLDPEVARAFAVSGAVVTAGLMAGMLGKVGGELPGVKQLMQRLGAQTVEKALAQQTTRQTVQLGLKKFGTHWLQGGLMMAGQSALSAVSEEGAKDYSGQAFEVRYTSALDAAGRGFEQGMTDMFLLSAFGPGRRMLKDIGRARTSAESAVRLEAMTNAVNASKLAERFGPGFEAFVRKAKAEKGAVESVGVPFEQWTSYWSEKKVDPAKVAAEVIGDGGKKFAEAAATKGDVVIPVEKWLSKLARSEHGPALLEDARLRPDELTPREHVREQKRQKDELERQAKVRGAEVKSGKQEVHDFIKEQALGAGVSKKEAEANAKLVSEFAGNMALRLGVSVQEAAALSALGQLRISGPKGEAVAAVARARFNRFLRPEASQYLRDRLLSLSAENRAKELYLDQYVSGLRHKRAFDKTKVPEGRQVAVITSPDVKGINDHPTAGGHDVTNEMLRAMGAAIGAEHPEAARGGTNFYLHVKDRAELDAVLQRVRDVFGGQKLHVLGELGADAIKAMEALDRDTDRRRGALKTEEGQPPPLPLKAGEAIPQRGGLAPELDVGSLRFPEGKAKGEVPVELVDEVARMSDREFAESVYLDTVDVGGEKIRSGLLTYEGWKAIPRKLHASSIDAKGLKVANKYGKNTGNQLLFAIADSLSHYGGSSFDVAHLGGDEFAAQSNDPIALERFVKRVHEKLAEYELEGLNPSTGKWEAVPVDFRYGVGADYGKADRNLNQRKAGERPADQAQGQRSPGDGRDGGPRDVPQEVEDGARGRGARPQGFEEVVTHFEGVPVTFRGGGGSGGGEGGGGDASFDFANEQLRAEADGYVGAIRDEAKKAYAQAWLAYTSGATDERPNSGNIPLATVREVSRELSKFGYPDPEGFEFDQSGRDLSALAQRRSSANRKKGPGLDPYARRAARAGVGLSGAAAENLDRRQRGEAVFYAGSPDAPRGQIQLQLDPTGRPRAFNIRVLEGDASTLPHETAHFMSWSLHDIATSDLATADIRTDYATLLKFAGYESPEQRLAEVKEKSELETKDQLSEGDEKRIKELAAKEERISHGWEQYLLEGKAPSEGLAKVFTRFKDWLLKVYRGVAGVQQQYRETYGEELNLSDDVRRVFDRLLAQDDAMLEARDATGVPAEPPPEVVAAMTPEEREAYRKALADSRLAADIELQRRAVEIQEERVGPERERIRTEVAAELDRQPAYRAERYLQRGELVDENGQPVTELPATLRDDKGQPFKLNRAAFVAQFGKELARAMPAGIFDRAKKGGTPPEQLAPLLGFESAEDLVGQLVRNERRDSRINRETQGRIDATYGPALGELAAAAMKAIHNEDSAKAVLLELRALAKQVNPATAARVNSIDLKVLKGTAERLIGESPVGDLDPDRYARVERQTARAADELWRAGDRERALEQREARLWNQLLYRAARAAAEELEVAERKNRTPTAADSQRLIKAGPEYRDVHDFILSSFGLGEAPTAEAKTLDDLVKKADEDAATLGFDVAELRRLLKNANNPNSGAVYDWGNLTVDEARLVSDAITNIRHIAKEAVELQLEGLKQAKDAWFQEVEQNAEKRGGLPAEPIDKEARTAWQKLKHLGRGADAVFTDVAETYAHMLDNGDRQGPAHRLLVDARLASRDKYTKLAGEVLRRIEEKWNNIPKEIRKLVDKKVQVDLPVPAGSEGRFTPVYTRSTLWMLFLNWGNEGNRQRIRDGNGWGDEQVQRALDLLSPAETKFLQGVLDTINSLYPDVAALHERRTGLKLGKVDAVPIVVNGEELSGGYFPLKYRPEFSRAGEMQEGDIVKSLFAPNYVRPSTPKSHTKERAERVEAPVDLSWGVVPAHLAQVIHDISYGDWVRQAGGILFDPRFKAVTAEQLGPERAKEFVPWLRDVANSRADSASGAQSTFLEEAGAFARNRAAIAVMGMNLPAVLPQILDPWNAHLENVPAHHIASAYVKVNTHLAGLIDMPEFALSKELAYRDAALKTNLREGLSKLGPTGKGVGRAVSETAFALYELSDRYTSRVTWKAAFDHAQSEGLPDVEAAAQADDVVRRIYASHDIAEKPPIMRSKKGLAALVMFYGFANRLYNSGRRSVADVARTFSDPEASAGDKVTAVARIASKLMVMGLTGAAFAYIAGRGPKKDDDWKKWLAWRVALEPLNTVPFMGAAVEGLVVKGQKVSMRTSPELALMQDMLNRLGEGVEAAIDRRGSRADQERIILSVEALVGTGLLVAGAPVGQLGRTGGYFEQLATGKARPRNAADVASGLVYGQREKQGRNPLSDLGDAIGR